MEKKFDAVVMMRAIRNKLGKQYKKNPALRKKRLERVRRKYGITQTITKVLSTTK